MRHIQIIIIYIITLFVFESSARGDCLQDADCKDDNLCRDGTCITRNQSTDSQEMSAGATQSETPPVTICEQISCSGHGNCIMRDKKPLCACHEGYQPDSAEGLNCVPIEESQASSVSGNQTSGTGDAASEEGEASGGRAELKMIQAALPGYSHEADFLMYGYLLRAGRIQGTFLDYKIYRTNKRRKGGVALVVLGSIVLATGIAGLIVYGIVDEQTPLIIGTVLAPASTALLVPGIVVLLRAKRTMKVLQSLATSLSFSETKATRFSLTPIFDQRSSALGLAGSISF